ncbi:metallophosphoesterase [Candidatus Woesearchaeota archaeon]|nr:metallophosphoesterase [Candidatus Woesearchaeota archaeon]
MDVKTVTNYLIDQGELIDEDISYKLEKLFSISEKEERNNQLLFFFKKYFPEIDISALGIISQKEFKNSNNSRISIIKSHEKTPGKHQVKDFVKYFTIRFKSLERMLKSRPELVGLTSINRLRGRSEKEKTSIIGMVLEKDVTKNGHVILELEDLTGTTKVLIHKDNIELLSLAKDLTLDEVIGVMGSSGKDIVFANTIVQPDVPLSKELKKSPLDNYAIFFGDFHMGSKEFLRKEFHRVLLWLNGKLGTLEQREIAKKVKYVFIVGDVIEGVGIYPSQEEDLEIDNCKGQYDVAAEYLKKIPSHIKIIICPGNHDVGRIAEPQLPIDKEYGKALWDMENVILVSNPAYVAVDVTKEFSGIDVLMYHGYSLIYYSDAIPSLRAAGGQKVADDIMIYLLKRRHLAPSHGSTLYIPDTQEDPLVIDPIPDIFVTGHIHRAQVKNYRNVTCINSSGWTEITEDQEKRGLEPQPARILALSLKSREIKVMNFSTRADATSVAELKSLKEKEVKEKAAKAAAN